MVDKNHIFKLEKSEVMLRKDGIVQVEFKDNCEITEVDCEAIYLAFTQILEHKKYPILHLSDNYATFTKDAREYSITEKGMMFSAAEAYVSSSLAHKLVANFYIKMNKPPVPTKFFTNEADAVDWLTKFL